MRRLTYISATALVLLFVPTAVAFAQIKFVVCEGNICNACYLVRLANLIIDFLMFLSVILATIMFIYAGFLFVTAAGNQAQLQKGKKMFTDVFIGILIVLTGYLIVDTVMKLMVGNDLLGGGPWQSISCPVPNPTPSAPSEPITIGPTPTSPLAPGCATCKSIEGIPCKHQQSCTVDASYAKNLSQLSGYGLMITEAYPPTINHQNPCHSNGTCTDIVFTNNDYGLERVKQFQADAAKAGYRAVYEPAGDCPAGISDCQPRSVTRATGTHFSLYKAN